MAINYLSPINLNQLELQNAQVHNLASAPSNPVEGQIYMNTNTGKLMYYDGSEWVALEAKPSEVLMPAIISGNSTAGIIAGATIKNYVENMIAAADAMIFKGTLGTGGTVTSLPTTYKTGWTYRVITAGTYAGNVCEVGDLIIALTDRSGSGNLDADWCVAQTNIDGALTDLINGTGISVSGSGSSRTISLASGVISATSKGDTINKTPSWGDTFKALSATVDTYGRVTALAEHTVKIPNALATQSASGLMDAGDKLKLDELDDAVVAKTVTWTPTASELSKTITGLIYSYKAFDNTTGEEVVLGASRSSGGSLTLSVANAYPNGIKIVYLRELEY